MIPTSEWPSPWECAPGDLDPEVESKLKEPNTQIVECDASTEDCNSCGGCEDCGIVYLRKRQQPADPGIVPADVE